MDRLGIFIKSSIGLVILSLIIIGIFHYVFPLLGFDRFTPYRQRAQQPQTPDVIVATPSAQIGRQTEGDANNTLNDSASLINEKVLFSLTEVKEVLGGGVFWIGPIGYEVRDVLVVLNNRERAEGVEVSKQVRVGGVIRPLPSPQEVISEWRIEPAKLQQLESRSVYLSAEMFEIL